MSKRASPDYDALIVGAGFSGIYLLHKLRNAGFNVLLVDAAAEPGGIWYWNCYPGARVDSQVPIYEYSIPEVWKSWTWSERFPGWKELRAYFHHVCNTLKLWPMMRMGSRVTGANYEQAAQQWRLQLNGEETVTTRFLLPAIGFASKPHIPDFPGIEDFEGEWFHTARWPQQGGDLSGRKIALIGTGASGVQVAQEAAKSASKLTLFQRTPILALPMRQQKLSKEDQERDKQDYAAIFETRKQTSGGFESQSLDVSALEVDEKERTAHFEYLWQKGGLRFWYHNFADLLINREANRYAYDFWRNKVCDRISDPNMNITGTNGLSVSQAWEDGLRAYLGMAIADFPNMLFAYGPLSPSGFSNGPTSAEIQGDWICDFLVWMRDNDSNQFEACATAEADWTKMVAQAGAMTLFPEANSWYMGANIPGRKRQLINFPSVSGYVALCEEVANEGYRGFMIDKPTSNEQMME
mgnify:CR=1 FL=1